MANAGMKVSNTGAIGVYLVRGASQSVRSGQTGGATYYPLGTCDTFPRLATGTPLAPVVTDLFGSTPFDHYHGGMVGTIAMNLNRFSWINLLALVQGDMTAISAANAAAAETGTGFLLSASMDCVLAETILRLVAFFSCILGQREVVLLERLAMLLISLSDGFIIVLDFVH